ncbi:MAG: nucleotide exchange factor GrpE [Candidatus Sungbacteria bacterium RIFCSPLOWO2_12_FULL_41_11]|uniref:Protein GrpE n=1 Tax=Candidatus Sungbacteria bacterium RIFCSPLOWO2_12_FULL_41_11 TaxID=1802286 RepID=A0A1G2LPB4_9BACT|nr:MAG: Heat shock protein GrpE [Parcubacteria group bacterium GW2011_GWA2_42_14]OGZ98262.1 MAG: nucleotide exchange factor GrpE [Candidatus Sungbacteria bacterium RIFCSPHIGHO2_02_FULL_41_12b]OHA13364.1 MAG: nucleotide exchange factor GrpE [Candidatus Sungbacteria bacterium RIFCSPLOWO2_12_FULL_41_11]
MEEDKDTEEIEFVADKESEGIDFGEKIKKLKEDLKKCHDERKEYLDGWQRAKADYINFKKDEGKRFEDMARFVTTGLVQDLLPILDSFDLALGHKMPPEVEKGVLLIRSQFLDVLKRQGIEVMDVSGQKFDPAYHEAVGEAESDAGEGMIVEEIQKGYIFRGNVLRPARVKISK